MAIDFTIESGWHALTMYPVEREVFQEYGGDKIGTLLEAVAGGIPVEIARSFKEDLHAVATSHEVGRVHLHRLAPGLRA